MCFLQIFESLFLFFQKELILSLAQFEYTPDRFLLVKPVSQCVRVGVRLGIRAFLLLPLHFVLEVG